MKKMTCKQLGGACDEVFVAETFEEIAEMSKAHGGEMFKRQDSAHLEAMQALMQTPSGMKEWFEQKRQEFNALPEE